MTMSFHGGLLLGPPLGGFVIDWLSWRWIFFLLVPIGVAGTVLTVLRARGRRPAPVERPPAVDYVGAVLLVVLTAVLTLVVDRRSAEALGRRTTRASCSSPSSSVSSASSSTSAAPSIPWSTSACSGIRMFVFSVLSLLVFATTTSVLNFLLPFYIQDVLASLARRSWGCSSCPPRS